jgi:4-hydroxy-tetrahydrodipicolinate reductase
MRQDPYRVIVWGPGGIGRACLKQLVKRDDCEIVGVLAYSPEKNGKDVGELIGQDPIGVTATTDQEAILALDADVVLYTAMLPFDMPAMEDVIISCLESGKNVINAAGFHYAHNHTAEYVEKFEAACRKGGVSLHGSGENPGFWFERLALTLTGVTNEVDTLYLHGFCDISTSGSQPETLAGLSIGASADQATLPPPMAMLWEQFYFVEILNMGSIALFGRPLDRVDHEPTYHVTERDVVLSKAQGHAMDLTVPSGHVHALTHAFTGFLDDRPRLGITVNWFLRPENAPFELTSEDSWLIEIEGRPVSVRCQINAMASLKDKVERRPGDQTSSTYYVTGAVMIQAIPMVVAAEPGFLYPSVFTTSTTDLRSLAERRDIVDRAAPQAAIA